MSRKFHLIFSKSCVGTYDVDINFGGHWASFLTDVYYIFFSLENVSGRKNANKVKKYCDDCFDLFRG